jgi:cell division protein FtsB
MARFKNPAELEDFIEKLEKANEGLSADVKKLREQLKKLRKQEKASEIEKWFFGTKEEDEDEDE